MKLLLIFIIFMAGFKVAKLDSKYGAKYGEKWGKATREWWLK